MTTLRSVCDALVRVRAASGAGVEDTTRAGRRGSASGLRPLALALASLQQRIDAAIDAIDAPRRRSKAPRDAPPTRKNV